MITPKLSAQVIVNPQMVGILPNFPELRVGAVAATGWSVVQSTVNPIGVSTITNRAFVTNVTAGNTIVAYANGFESPGPCKILYFQDTQIDSYTIVLASASAGDLNLATAFAYAKNVAGGATTVRAVWDASCGATSLHIMELSGLSATAPIQGARGNSAAAATCASGVLQADGSTKGIISFASDDNAAVAAITQVGNYATRGRVLDGANYWQSAIGDFGTFATNTITSTQFYSSTWTIPSSANSACGEVLVQ